ncbi:hypothetical protein TNCV_3444961 [Trichonephila clavipes]|nr:hypothetical protein TNCV_3444961 [Trichonephila clavipes]
MLGFVRQIQCFENFDIYNFAGINIRRLSPSRSSKENHRFCQLPSAATATGPFFHHFHQRLHEQLLPYCVHGFLFIACGKVWFTLRILQWYKDS